MLVRDPAVHRELTLSKRASEQVSAAVAEIDQPMWLLRDVPVSKCGPQLDQHIAQLRAPLERILSPEQQSRLDEIILQARGFKGLLSADLAKKLALTGDQSKQIRDLIVQAGNSGDSKRRGESSDVEKVLNVLTARQADEWSASLGKSFDLSRVRQIGCLAPELRGASEWINTDPLTLVGQRGKVVAVHFWAFGCINCVHNLPHYQAWYEAFPKSKLTVIGIHTPETEREKVVDNLRASVAERRIEYPVAVDAAAENWKAWGNHMWPSVYLIDKRGQVRNWWYGELNWQGATGEAFLRKRIETLIAED
jgi:thiol-disulfide isomerase/thioredoxin